MTAWTSAERVSIRKYLGFPTLFRQIEPRIENAIQSVQAVADGGVLPDDSTQASMRAVLAKLDSLETKISDLYCQFQIEQVGKEELHLNMSMALAMFKSEGRRLIHQLSIPLGTRVVRDYFGQSEMADYNSSNPFILTDL